MSIQFGSWNLDGQTVDPAYLEKVREIIDPYGADRCVSLPSGGAHILYFAFHTVWESRKEKQPWRLASGDVLTWDGRLDNRAELIGFLPKSISPDSSDVAIVAAVFERWGTDCLSRLIGDWSLAVWSPKERCLTLAKDPIGVRHLYYSAEPKRITWSTVLDPLVLLADRRLALEDEYLAGWLSVFPATHLTPYVGISAVPPACLVCLKPGSQTVTKYWDFDPAKRIRYASDGEYEEHFRMVFAESVRRRIRCDAPVLAELSGGVDSSSIVCMADRLITEGTAETPRLDTVSYYDDSEPNWNERPYFMQVEQKRGQPGCHIRVDSRAAFLPHPGIDRFAASPGAGRVPTEASKDFAACRVSNGNRVVLSGIGGDEVAGGVPTPIPELATLLAGFQYRALARRLKAWALCKRQPWAHLLFDTVRPFLPAGFVSLPGPKSPIAWVNPELAKHNRPALTGYESRLKFFGAPPSFQENLGALQMIKRQLACSCMPFGPPYEQRYPYLDRQLLEFLFAIPREQLVRPGQRRSLIRRALAGLVPDMVLNRRRKAFVVRSPMVEISILHSDLVKQAQHMICSSLGFVDSKVLCEVLHKARLGQDVPIVPLMRTFALETWLLNLRRWDVRLEVRLPPLPSVKHRGRIEARLETSLANKGSIRPG